MIRIHEQRITIVSVQREREENLNAKLQWFGQTLGLFNPRDKDSSCFRVFIELLKAAKFKAPLSSDDIAFRLSLSRGTVVHHITKLMESGLVIAQGNRYMLRVNSLDMLAKELQKDAERSFLTLREVAQDLDKDLGL